MPNSREIHGVRNALILLGIIIISVLVAIAILIFVAFHSAKERNSTIDRVEAQAKDNAERERTAKINAYAVCLRGADVRKRTRRMFEDQLTIFISAQIEEPTRTQEEVTKRVVSWVHTRSLEVLPDINCSKIAPLPPNVTTAERDLINLPSEPIPPLTIP